MPLCWWPKDQSSEVTASCGCVKEVRKKFRGSARWRKMRWNGEWRVHVFTVSQWRSGKQVVWWRVRTTGGAAAMAWRRRMRRRGIRFQSEYPVTYTCIQTWECVVCMCGEQWKLWSTCRGSRQVVIMSGDSEAVSGGDVTVVWQEGMEGVDVDTEVVWWRRWRDVSGATLYGVCRVLM